MPASMHTLADGGSACVHMLTCMCKEGIGGWIKVCHHQGKDKGTSLFLHHHQQESKGEGGHVLVIVERARARVRARAREIVRAHCCC